MKLLFVTGVSCAGKTTLGQQVQKARPEVDVHDLDEDAGVRPGTAWLDWLRWQAAEQLLMADEMSRRLPLDDQDHLLIVTGIVWPFRVIESPAWASAVKNRDLHVGWVMLDPPWRVIRERLTARVADKPKAEQKELLRYNRELRRGLRHQVGAMRYGWVWTDADQASCLDLIVNDQLSLMPLLFGGPA
jgi:shikimate kinase